MPADLLTQIRAYADHVDAVGPTLEELYPDLDRELDRTIWRPPIRRWVVAVAAAIGVLIFVGVIGLLLRSLTEDAPPVTEPLETTTTAPSQSFGPLVTSTIGDGFPPGVVIAGDGLPLIVFQSGDSPETHIVKCGDPSCSTISSTSTVPFPGQEYIAVGPDGLPVMAFTPAAFTPAEEGTDELSIWVVKCNDVACADYTQTQIGAQLGVRDLAVGPDNTPAIVASGLEDDTNTVFIRCLDPACAEHSTVPFSEGSQSNPSLSIGTDNIPVVVLTRAAAGSEDAELHVIRCQDPECAGARSETVTPLGHPTNFNFAATLDSRNRPVVVFGLRPLNLLRCDDPNCDVWTEPVPIVDEFRNEGLGVIIALSASDAPVIAMAARGPDDVEPRVVVASCSDPMCSSVTLATIGTVDGDFLSMVLDASDLPLVAYSNFDGVNVGKCGDPACVEGAVETSQTEPAASPPVTTPAFAPDLEGWTQLSGDEEVFGPFGTMHAIAAGGLGIVAAGEVCDTAGRETDCSANIWFSPDGAEWQRTLVGVAFGQIDVAVSDDVALVVADRCEEGDENCQTGIWRTTNGADWTESPGPSGVQLGGVVTFGSRFVAIGGNGEGMGVWTSDDGLTWTKQTLPLEEEEWLGWLVAGENSVVAFADRCQEVIEGGEVVDYVCTVSVFNSSDGETWVRAQAPEDMLDGFTFVTAAGFTPQGFLALGATCDLDFRCELRVWASADGQQWASLPVDPADFGNVLGEPQHFASAGSVVMTAGSHTDQFNVRAFPVFWLTQDGVNWELHQAPEAVFVDHSDVRGLASYGDRIFAVGEIDPGRPAIWVWDPSAAGF